MLNFRFSCQHVRDFLKDVSSENSIMNPTFSFYRCHSKDVQDRSKVKENVYFRKRQYEQLQRLKKLNEEQLKKINNEIDKLMKELKNLKNDVNKGEDKEK